MNDFNHVYVYGACCSSGMGIGVYEWGAATQKMKLSENCKCRLSCELLFIRNDEPVGLIGKMVVDYVIRHATLLCPIETHQITTENLK